MNIFNVLGVTYEVFHSRMLLWLWSPNADHAAGSTFIQPFFEMLGLPFDTDYRIDIEMKVASPNAGRWRLVDLVIRVPGRLILIENKVDPGYQDALQIEEEIAGGRELAVTESRELIFVLIAPGPLSIPVEAALNSARGRFVAWHELLTRLEAISRQPLDAAVSEIIGQYFAFARSPRASKVAAANEKVLRESESAIRELVREFKIGAELTAVDLWPRFLEKYPDHAAALEGRWADSTHYSTKTWFAATLLRLARARELIEETGAWQTTDGSWGFPKVRVYRRISSTGEPFD